MPNPATPDQQVSALSVLYQTEIEANIGELQATTAIVLGMLAYLAGTIFFMENLTPGQVPFLPLGVAFGCAYQMLRAGVVVRRAALARAYERRLLVVLGVETDFDNGRLGSPFYGAIDDIGVIAGRKAPGWRANIAVAVLAYFGLYGLAITYTTLVLLHAVNVGTGVAAYVWCAAYVALWCGLGWGAYRLFKPIEPAALPRQ